MVDFYESFYKARYGRNLDIQGYKIGLNPPCSEWQIICELVRKENTTFFDSNKIVKLFEQYIINKLKDDYLFDRDVSTPIIKYDAKIECSQGEYNSESNEITVPINFAHDQKNIIRNFNTLAHELRHFAQYKGKRKDGLTLNPTPIYLNYRLINSALSFDSLTDQEKQDVIQNPNSPASQKYFGRGKLLNLIADRDYYNDEVEMDARGFALNITLELFDFINNPNLHLGNTELKNIYNEQLDYLTELEREQLEIGENVSDEEYMIYQNNVKNLRENILAKYPNLLDIYANNHSEFLQICKKHPFPLFPTLCQSLIISYDDQFAHQLLNAFLDLYSHNSGTIVDFRDIIRLLYVTPINLTPLERDTIVKLFGAKVINTIDEMQNSSRAKISTQEKIRKDTKEQQFDGFLKE